MESPEIRHRRVRKIEVLQYLLELDPFKLYRNIELILYLISKGLTHYSADKWVKVLAREGFLKRISYGLYQLDRKKMEKELEYLTSRKKEKELEELEKKEEKEVEYA